MKEEDLLKIIKLHELTCKLKTTLRQGWLCWKVEDVRIESIAEHIFGTCMLAMGIYAAQKSDIDINKVFVMLVLHETEEIIIGDLTPFDIDKNKTKKIDGRNAVLKIFEGFSNAQCFIDIIEEFEEGKTKEAKFSHMCDKFEANLQAKLYDKKFNLNKVSDKILRDERVVALNNKGYNKVCELFLQNNKQHYDGVFKQLAEILEKLEKFI